MKDLINLGRIVRPHGVKGEVKILSDFDNTTLNPKLKTVFVDNQKYAVEGIKFMNESLVLKLEGINSMNDAESFRDKQVFVSHDDLVELDDDEYYIDDLVGCEVVLDDGQTVGKLFDINNYGATDILVIKDGTEEILCPWVDDLLVDVDFDTNKIVLNKKAYLEVTQYED